jgi:hypothetical protein
MKPFHRAVKGFHRISIATRFVTLLQLGPVFRKLKFGSLEVSMRRVPLVVLLVSLFTTAALTQNNAVPFLNQPLIPDSVAPGHSAFKLTVTGTGFASGAVVNWNGSPRATTFISSSQLQAAITATDVAQHGTATVTIVNPSPRGGTSNVVYFPVQFHRTAVAFARSDTPLTPPLGLTSGLQGLVTADFNNDGKPDLALGWCCTASGVGEIDIWMGNGNGTFQTPIATSVNFEFNNLVAGDFNGDGNLDLAVAQPTGNNGCPMPLLYAFLGTGDGHLNLAAGGGKVMGWPLAVADINGDGRLDLVTTSTDFGCDTWFPAVNLGNGDGTFGNPIQVGTLGSYSTPAIGDFNRDGILDLAFFDSVNFGMDAFLGKGDGSFQSALFSATKNAAVSAVAGDLNLDGKLDIVTDGVDSLQGNGDGTFSDLPGPNIDFGSSNGFLQLADLNGDHRLDAAFFAQGVSTLLGNGSVSFQNPQTWLSGRNLGTGPAGVVQGVSFGVADFYGDGRLGFAVADLDFATGLPVLSIFRQTTVGISPTFLDFGGVRVGHKSPPQTATLSNIGNAALPLSIHLTKGGNYLETDNCGTSLPAGGSCTISVIFAPRGKGTITSEARVKYTSALGSPQYIELSGTGD